MVNWNHLLHSFLLPGRRRKGSRTERTQHDRCGMAKTWFSPLRSLPVSIFNCTLGGRPQAAEEVALPRGGGESVDSRKWGPSGVTHCQINCTLICSFRISTGVRTLLTEPWARILSHPPCLLNHSLATARYFWWHHTAREVLSLATIFVTQIQYLDTHLILAAIF